MTNNHSIVWYYDSSITHNSTNEVVEIQLIRHVKAIKILHCAVYTQYHWPTCDEHINSRWILCKLILKKEKEKETSSIGQVHKNFTQRMSRHSQGWRNMVSSMGGQSKHPCYLQIMFSWTILLLNVSPRSWFSPSVRCSLQVTFFSDIFTTCGNIESEINQRCYSHCTSLPW